MDAMTSIEQAKQNEKALGEAILAGEDLRVSDGTQSKEAIKARPEVERRNEALDSSLLPNLWWLLNRLPSFGHGSVCIYM